MRLVLDMNLPPAWAARFRAAGFDAVPWIEVGPPAAPDALVMDWARTQGRVVVTQDLDFGSILALTGAAGPSVVQIRADDLIDAAAAERVIAALRQVGDAVARGALVTIDLFRTRIRLLPIGD